MVLHPPKEFSAKPGRPSQAQQPSRISQHRDWGHGDGAGEVEESSYILKPRSVHLRLFVSNINLNLQKGFYCMKIAP